MSYLLAIDQGTTSTRCVVYDEELNIVHSAQQAYPLIYPEDGWVEVNPSELLASVYQTLDPMLDLSLEIVCAGITNQREKRWCGMLILASLSAMELFGRTEEQLPIAMH